MDKVTCPACGKMIMSVEKIETLLQKATSKTLLSNCLCGEAFSVRSPKRNVYEISTSSGKRVEHFIEDRKATL